MRENWGVSPSPPCQLFYVKVQVGHFHNPVSPITPMLSALKHFPAGLALHLQLLAFVSCSQGLQPKGVMMLYCKLRKTKAWA